MAVMFSRIIYSIYRHIIESVSSFPTAVDVVIDNFDELNESKEGIAIYLSIRILSSTRTSIGNRSFSQVSRGLVNLVIKDTRGSGRYHSLQLLDILNNSISGACLLIGNAEVRFDQVSFPGFDDTNSVAVTTANIPLSIYSTLVRS